MPRRKTPRNPSSGDFLAQKGALLFWLAWRGFEARLVAWPYPVAKTALGELRQPVPFARKK
jgi:hypothetical protein